MNFIKWNEIIMNVSLKLSAIIIEVCFTHLPYYVCIPLEPHLAHKNLFAGNDIVNSLMNRALI